METVFTHTLPPGHAKSDVVEPGQYEPTLHVALEAEFTQYLLAGQGNAEEDPAAQYVPSRHV
jgi:hypothetical protein